MNKRLFLVVWVLLVGSLTLRAQVESPAYRDMLRDLLAHSVPEMSVQKLHQLDKSTYLLLDAREKKEYEVSHLAKARHVGYDYFQASSVQNLPKDKTIIVYCSVGYRSEKISEKLIKMGYTKVFNLYGGIFEWKNQGYPVVNKQGVTEAVHAYDRTWGKWLRAGKKVY